MVGLARFIGPGKLQLIGRMDGVVKIRGHRIDVGDIEAFLLDHSNGSEAVVISRNEGPACFVRPFATQLHLIAFCAHGLLSASHYTHSRSVRETAVPTYSNTQIV